MTDVVLESVVTMVDSHSYALEVWNPASLLLGGPAFVRARMVVASNGL